MLIVSEAANTRSEYRGLVFKTASSSVTLRGQLGNKHSECLLPSVNVDCIYHFDVTVGRIRFFHTSYNPDTRNWDLPPLPGQEISVDLVARRFSRYPCQGDYHNKRYGKVSDDRRMRRVPDFLPVCMQDFVQRC